MSARKVRRVVVLLLAATGIASCGGEEPKGSSERQCDEASERVGELACVHRLESEAAWESVSVPLNQVDQVRSAKYLVPASESAKLAPVILNSKRWQFHYDFMVEAFPSWFAGLSPGRYLDMLFDPEAREYLAGAVTEYRSSTGETRFGLTVVGDPQAPDLIGCEDFVKARDVLEPRLGGRSLAVVASDEAQRGFIHDCDLPVLDAARIDYEAYHRGVGFGTLRRYRPEELPDAVENAEFGFQDVLVLEQAPSDLDTVISGAITGTRQAPLSHLAVRSASRGTPNCFLDGAYDRLEEWEGELVRIECGLDTLTVRRADREEAERYWEELRPPAAQIRPPDADYDELVRLSDLPTDSAEARATAVTRFGAKGQNLAWLRQNLEAELTPDGFLIPVSAYLRFVRGQSWLVDLGDGEQPHTFQETLESWFADEAFTTDAALRRARLLALQEAFKEASCEDELLERVGEQLVEVFGDPSVTARFRSSSNAEDGAFFNGAGLYDSYSGCWADDLDEDEEGPSVCDPDEDKERGVCRALKRVWASLWNPKAYDERAFYGIDQREVAMAVLVNERSEAERANMVAFSGNPLSRGDSRFLVNAQIDELPVVSPEPNVAPEQVLLTVEDGAVSRIDRVAASSELPEGEHVLSDAELEELGAVLRKIADRYPFDAEAPDRREFLVDTEWKLMPDGSLRVKQVRPFLK